MQFINNIYSFDQSLKQFQFTKQSDILSKKNDEESQNSNVIQREHHRQGMQYVRESQYKIGNNWKAGLYSSSVQKFVSCEIWRKRYGEDFADYGYQKRQMTLLTSNERSCSSSSCSNKKSSISVCRFAWFLAFDIVVFAMFLFRSFMLITDSGHLQNAKFNRDSEQNESLFEFNKKEFIVGARRYMSRRQKNDRLFSTKLKKEQGYIVRHITVEVRRKPNDFMMRENRIMCKEEERRRKKAEHEVYISFQPRLLPNQSF